jgi:hypothetical protein
MSNYFFQRIKNLPTSTNSTSRLVQPPKKTTTTTTTTTVKTEATITISDDELLDSALKFEQTPQFKKAEEEARKARGEYIFSFPNLSHQFLQNLKSTPRVFVHFTNNQHLLLVLHHHSKVRSF